MRHRHGLRQNAKMTMRFNKKNLFFQLCQAVGLVPGIFEGGSGEESYCPLKLDSAWLNVDCALNCYADDLAPSFIIRSSRIIRFRRYPEVKMQKRSASQEPVDKKKEAPARSSASDGSSFPVDEKNEVPTDLQNRGQKERDAPFPTKSM